MLGVSSRVDVSLVRSVRFLIAVSDAGTFELLGGCFHYPLHQTLDELPPTPLTCVCDEEIGCSSGF